MTFGITKSSVFRSIAWSVVPYGSLSLGNAEADDWWLMTGRLKVAIQHSAGFGEWSLFHDLPPRLPLLSLLLPPFFV